MSDKPYQSGHLAALRRFALLITLLTVAGHAYLGFEQSIAQPLVAVATAYGMQLLLELVDAWSRGRRPRFAGGLLALVDFLLSPHITALSVSMLLFYNDSLWLVAFAVGAAVGSKWVFRVPVGSGTRHVFNPSNFGITATLLAFPQQVGLAPPWQFTAELGHVGHWLLPLFFLVAGTLINGLYTKRLPLIVAFVVGFIGQALLRSLFFQASLLASLAPMTGVAALIFTFYMIPDPATTPDRPWRQVVFGATVPALYLVFMIFHVVFGLFIGLTIICAVRGLGLYALSLAADRRAVPEKDLTAAPALAKEMGLSKVQEAT